MTPAARSSMLRAAHARVQRHRTAGEEIPFWLRVLESEYQAERRDQGPASRRRAVAAAIRSAREAAGMSQRGLAAAVGVSRPAVQWWERGTQEPSAERWVQLELTLGPLGVVREADPRPEPQERSEGEADAA